ncbi:MAG: hypothetical protein ACREJQ_06350 [bacterium]
MRTLRATAPTRIDFAGGTLDLPPLYLMHQPAYTVNVAIELRARVIIEQPDCAWSGVALTARDRNLGAQWPSAESIDWAGKPWLELPARLIQSLAPNEGIRVTTELESPSGAGIGGSSTLAIALTGGLLALRKENWPPARLIEHAKGAETQTIRVPTGYQDFIAAYYGGASVIEYTLTGFVRRPACSSRFLDTLESHLLLVYSGKPHFSGANNWELFKKHMDGDKRTISFFADLRESAEHMKDAFKTNRVRPIAEAMNHDWAIRYKMLPKMSTPKIDRLIADAMNQGAYTARVCGAGGGGCVAFLIDPAARARIQQIAKRLNCIALPSRIARTGLTILSTTV